MPINSFLLFNFAPNIRFAPDVGSSLRRFQTLAIIYLYLATVLKIFIFEFALMIFIPGSGLPIIGPFALLSSFIGLRLLRNGKSDASVAILLLCLHIGSLYLSLHENQPNAAFYCLFSILLMGVLLTSSEKVLVGNLAVCCLQTFNNARGLFNVYNHRNAFDEDALANFSFVIISALTSLFLTGVGCFAQRFIETNLVKIAESNYQKSENLTKELFQAADAQERIVSSVSQEISNPFNSIIASVNTLVRTSKAAANLQLLEKIKLNSEVLLNVLNNSLSLAKLKSNKLEISCSMTSLEEIIKKALCINLEKLKAKGVFIQVTISQSIPNSIYIDSSKLFQIIMNLISNAIRHTPQNKKIRISATWYSMTQTLEEVLAPTQSLSAQNQSSFASTSFQEFSEEEEQTRQKNFASLNYAPPTHNSLEKLNHHNNSFNTINTSLETESKNEFWTISANKSEIRNQTQNGLLKIEVIDVGSGIAEQDLDNIFNLFSQKTMSADAEQRGAGLGLWICKQLCSSLGGDIKAYSQVSQGSNFVFCLPVFQQNIFKPTLPQKPEEIRALVVDDFEFNRDLHKLLLEKEGVKVTTASDGKEAFQIFQTNGSGYFDFIMTDIQMPEMDGFTSAKKIREWENASNHDQVDIYFVSGEYFSEDDVMAEFKTHGVKQETKNIWCMKKPIDLQNLKRIVAKYQPL